MPVVPATNQRLPLKLEVQLYTLQQKQAIAALTHACKDNNIEEHHNGRRIDSHAGAIRLLLQLLGEQF